MTYNDIRDVNNSIKPMELDGNKYATVNERVNGFRKLYPEGSVITEVIRYENGVAIIKATASDEKGKILSTGHAIERYQANDIINSTSFLENCETSAVGRALGFLGIGIDTSISPGDDVARNKNLVRCPICNKVIEQVISKKDGSIWSPKKILDKYHMCGECYKKHSSITLENALKFKIQYKSEAKIRKHEGEELGVFYQQPQELLKLCTSRTVTDDTKMYAQYLAAAQQKQAMESNNG